MDESIYAAVQAVHDAPARIALVAAGAGVQALAWLMDVPGASRTLLEGAAPYGRHAMPDYLGWQPPHVVSAQTAISLAAAAYSRAVHLREDDAPLLGVSCTASLASDRPKRGDHRVHVAVWDRAAVTVYSLFFEKGRRTREEEEHLSSLLTLRAITLACGLPPFALPELAPEESVVVARHSVDRPLERLLDASVGSLMYYGPGAFVADEPLLAAILSGSFNPLHDGHYRLARAAARRLGLPVVYELSVYNVDKPPLSTVEIERRLAQFVDRPRRVVLTCEPLYSGKAALFPGCTFVIGYDTAARLVDPRYYHGDPGAVRAALRAIREQGCRFLVAGRLVGGAFRTLADVAVADGFDDLFDSLPEDDFRLDLSSTDLRERGIWLPDT